MSRNSKEKLEKLIKDSLLQICKSNINSLCEVDGIICISIQDTNSEPEQLVIRIHENLKNNQGFIAHSKNVPYIDPSLKNKLEFLDNASALKKYLSSSSSQLSSSSSLFLQSSSSSRWDSLVPSPGINQQMRQQVMVNNAMIHSGVLSELVKRRNNIHNNNIHNNSINHSNVNNNIINHSNINSNNYVFNLSINKDRNVKQINENFNNAVVGDLSTKNKQSSSNSGNHGNQLATKPISVSSSPSSFTCGLCLNGFLTYDALEVHFSSFHSSTLTHFCDDCNIGFESEVDCSTHRSSVHNLKYNNNNNNASIKNISNINNTNNSNTNSDSINRIKTSTNTINYMNRHGGDYNSNDVYDDDHDEEEEDENDGNDNDDDGGKIVINNSTAVGKNDEGIPPRNKIYMDGNDGSEKSPPSPTTLTNASRRKQLNPKKGITEDNNEWESGEVMMTTMINDCNEENDEDEEEEDIDDNNDDDIPSPVLKIVECNNNDIDEADRNLQNIHADDTNDSHYIHNNNKNYHDNNNSNTNYHDNNNNNSNQNLTPNTINAHQMRPTPTIVITPNNNNYTAPNTNIPNANAPSLKCPLCSEPFGTFSHLEEHCYLDHRRYLCNICPMTFTQKVTKDRHIYQQHAGNKPFPCEDCDSSFTRRDALRKHQMKCNHGSYGNGGVGVGNGTGVVGNGNGGGIIINNTGGYSYGSNSSGGALKIVIQKQGGECAPDGNMVSVLNKSIILKGIGDDGSGAVNLSRIRLKNLNSNKTDNNEDSCLDLSQNSSSNTIAATAPSLLKLVKTTHSSSPNITKRLLTTGHGGDGEAMIIDDDTQTDKVRTTPLSYHSYDITNDDNSNNNISSSLPSSPSSLYGANVKQYNCDKCNFTCEGAVSYKEHCRLVHRRTPCLHCGKTFSQKGNMERHRRQHTGERPFSCPHCFSSYTRRETLKSHMSQAHGIKLLPQVPNSSTSSSAGVKYGGIRNGNVVGEGGNGLNCEVSVKESKDEGEGVNNGNVVFEIAPLQHIYPYDGDDNDIDDDEGNDDEGNDDNIKTHFKGDVDDDDDKNDDSGNDNIKMTSVMMKQTISNDEISHKIDINDNEEADDDDDDVGDDDTDNEEMSEHVKDDKIVNDDGDNGDVNMSSKNNDNDCKEDGKNGDDDMITDSVEMNKEDDDADDKEEGDDVLPSC